MQGMIIPMWYILFVILAILSVKVSVEVGVEKDQFVNVGMIHQIGECTHAKMRELLVASQHKEYVLLVYENAKNIAGR